VRNKKFWLGLLVLALVLGMMVIGCESEDEEDPPPLEPGDRYFNPINRVESINLGDMTSPDSGWKQLLKSIESTGKYINLDLSACTMTGTSFNPDHTFREDKRYIVSLILPNAATSIAAGTDYYNNSFSGFGALAHIRGTNITTIEDYANFRLIETAYFPNVTNIGIYVFGGAETWTTTITMGAIAPANLSKNIFSFKGFSRTYTVKVKVPSGATGYTPFTGTSITVSGNNSDVNWANCFRCGGWNGSALTDVSSIDQYMSLIIEQQ